MKNKFLFFFPLLVCIAAYGFEGEKEIVNTISSTIEKNILLLNQQKHKIATTESDVIKNTSTYLAFKVNGLEKVFIFNAKGIMNKEISFENYIFSSKILNMNYLNLLKINSDKIYLSELFSYKNKMFYFLGFTNDNDSILMLFEINFDTKTKFAILNDKGETLINKFLSNATLKEYSKIILDASSDTIKSMENNTFDVFLKDKKYYLFEE